MHDLGRGVKLLIKSVFNKAIKMNCTHFIHGNLYIRIHNLIIRSEYRLNELSWVKSKNW